jgi:membrane protein DedA with SNARE-associated domain
MDYIIDILLNLYGPTPYFLIFGILVVCGLGIPIPEDITLFAAGLSAYYGLTNLWGIMFLSYCGVILGDSVIFLLGAKDGLKLTKSWFFHRLLPEDRLDIVRSKLHTQGNKLIFIARFMPGLRAPIYFCAGSLHLPYRIFLFYDGLAALISVPVIIGAVYYFGDELDRVVHIIQKIEHGIAFSVIAVVILFGFKWYLGKKRNKTSPTMKTP